MEQLPGSRLISAMPPECVAMTRQTVTTLQPPLITLINHYIAAALHSHHRVCPAKEDILTKHRMARLVSNYANVTNEWEQNCINRLHDYSILR